MRKFVKTLRSEDGFTVIELVASMALIAMFGGLIYGIITFGMNTYNKIEIENSLRDEADLIMSAIIGELYAMAPDKIIDWQNNHIGLLKEGEPDNDIYFGNNSLYIEDKEAIALKSDIAAGSVLKVECDAELGGCSSGLIAIKLVMQQEYAGKQYELTLESKFGF